MTILDCPPFTCSIGFVKAPLLKCVQDYCDGMAQAGNPNQIEECDSDVLATFARIAPIVWTSDVEFFVATSSEWTAWFANGYFGTDGNPVAAVAWSLKVETVYLRVSGDCVSFTVSGPVPNPVLNTVRHVGWLADAGRVEFSQSGVPLPFEDIERYKARRKRDRLTVAMVAKYAAAMGIRAYEDGFYQTQGVLVRHPIANPGRQMSLDEWRKENACRMVSLRGLLVGP